MPDPLDLARTETLFVVNLLADALAEDHLTYDVVNDAAEMLHRAAWRLAK